MNVLTNLPLISNVNLYASGHIKLRKPHNTESARRMDYSRDQHEEYLWMTEKVGEHWLQVFQNDTEFWSAVYWDLFTKLWRARGDVRKTDALRFMTAIKSAHTAGKYLETAIRRGLVEERENPEDARSKLVRLAPALRERLDSFLDSAVSEMSQASHRVTRPSSPT